MITHDELKATLHYDPSTGEFTRLKAAGRSKKGDVVGYCSHDRGYKQVGLNYKTYYIHRLAWFYMTGEWPELIDHIDGDTSNNRWANLRNCSMSENMQNMKSSGLSSNTSGHIGVHPYHGKWRAKIRHISNGKRYNTVLGTYNTVEEAAAAYKAAKKVLHKFHPKLTR